jgi:hypothetical protein
MPSEDMGTARGNCGFLDVSTILSKDNDSVDRVTGLDRFISPSSQER